jgi:hypothetical protein
VIHYKIQFLQAVTLHQHLKQKQKHMYCKIIQRQNVDVLRQQITWKVLLKSKERRNITVMFNDHMAGFGPYHRLLSSSPRQEGSWPCHLSSCRGWGSFSSPEICFFSSSLDPYLYHHPSHGHLCQGGGEGYETFHVHGRGRDRHGWTCGVGTHAYHNARRTKEGS